MNAEKEVELYVELSETGGLATPLRLVSERIVQIKVDVSGERIIYVARANRIKLMSSC